MSIPTPDEQHMIVEGSTHFVNTKLFSKVCVDTVLDLSKEELLAYCNDSLCELVSGDKYFGRSAEVRHNIDVECDYILHVCDVLRVFPNDLEITKEIIIDNLDRFKQCDLIENSYKPYVFCLLSFATPL